MGPADSSASWGPRPQDRFSRRPRLPPEMSVYTNGFSVQPGVLLNCGCFLPSQGAHRGPCRGLCVSLHLRSPRGPSVLPRRAASGDGMGTWYRCPLSDVGPDGYTAGLLAFTLQLWASPLGTRPHCRGFHASFQHTHLLCPWAASSLLWAGNPVHWAPGFLIRKERSRLCGPHGSLRYRLGCSMVDE